MIIRAEVYIIEQRGFVQYSQYTHSLRAGTSQGRRAVGQQNLQKDLYRHLPQVLARPSKGSSIGEHDETVASSNQVRIIDEIG